MQFVVGEHVAHALARAIAPQRHGNALAGALQSLHVLRDGLEYVGVGLGAFGDKIAPRPRAGVDDISGLRHGEGRQPRQRRSVEAFAPLGFRQIEPLRRQRLVRWRDAIFQRLLARFVIVGDLSQALMRGVIGQMFERQRRSRQVVEQSVEFPVKQRQPVLHARIAPAFAHRFVEQIVRAAGAELRDIAGAEAADGFSNELKFRDRHQIEPAQALFAALRLRFERTDRLQRVAEEIEPHRHVHAGRK